MSYQPRGSALVTSCTAPVVRTHRASVPSPTSRLIRQSDGHSCAAGTSINAIRRRSRTAHLRDPHWRQEQTEGPTLTARKERDDHASADVSCSPAPPFHVKRVLQEAACRHAGRNTEGRSASGASLSPLSGYCCPSRTDRGLARCQWDLAARKNPTGTQGA